MPKTSAGLLLYRRTHDNSVEVLIGHPGGPLWSKKDNGAWSIIKGEYVPGEDPWVAAQREFSEEVGIAAPVGETTELPPIKQKSGKVVTVFAVEGDLDIADAVSNLFEMEWPPKSGKTMTFPEIDRIEWFAIDVARVKLLTGHVGFLDSLEKAL